MAHLHNKIILNLMIKNESKIIERCLNRTLNYVDAISILDTGSTDNTVEICKNYLEKSGKPFKISVEEFKNFGYNRTISFQKTQELCKELEWNLNKTYAMTIDADMIIRPSDLFKNYELNAVGYSVIQQNGSLKYHNNRFMQCSYNWKCVGVTHECWNGEPVVNIPFEIFNIEDVNDGGCKSDKYERDIRLLTEDLKRDPDNARSHFYLAQSYKDIGKIKEAIKYYKKRIELGGWVEEVWYSYYQISKCYATLNEPEKMEAWALRAFKFYPKRSEPLYFLLNYFRITHKCFKAYEYYLLGKDIPFPKDDLLFIEYNVYNGLFEYENTIVSCYVFNKSRLDCLEFIVNYINTKDFYIDNAFDNIQYYTETLDSLTYNGKYSKYFFPKINEYHASSCSILPYDGKLLMNVSYVNYTIDNQGTHSIHSSDKNLKTTNDIVCVNSSKHPNIQYVHYDIDNQHTHQTYPSNEIIKTKNGTVILNSSYYPINDVSIMKEDTLITYPSKVKGLEHVHLFKYNNKIHFNASSKNLSNDGKIVMVIGEYLADEKKMTNISIIQPPRTIDNENNLIYIPENLSKVSSNSKMNFIYKWYPFEIGCVNKYNSLEIHTRFQTPRIFSRFSSSSNICEYNGKLWCLAHILKNSSHKVYLHSLVCFNRETMKPEMYSLPFVFKKYGIEYCIGMDIQDGTICFIFSQDDNEPGFITLPLNNLRFLNIS